MRGLCAHCGLPLPRRAVHGRVAGQDLSFCCTGCLLILRITGEPGEAGTTQGLFLRLGLSAFFAMNAMAFSFPAYFPFFYLSDPRSPGEQGYLLLLRVFALFLTLPVLGLLGAPILWQALRDMRGGLASVDALIALGSVAAFNLSLWNTATGSAHVYFDTVAMLLVLVALGRYLEARAKLATASHLSTLLAQVPLTAPRLDVSGETEVPTESLVPGDKIRVIPGQAFPTDGTILTGTVSVDESNLTGESRPVVKTPGEQVAAGTLALDGSVEMRVDRAVRDSTAARIAKLLDAARLQRSPSERLAEQVATLFLPIVLAIAAGALLFWTTQDGLEEGILVSLAVLVVACPCAFGIATPAATWIALGRAARRGILVRNGAVLERLGAVQRLYLDKTGTLTAGTLRLRRTVLDRECALPEREVLSRVAALQRHTLHPLATAMREVVQTVPELPFTDVRYQPGLGVEGWLNGTGPKHLLVAGSKRFVEQVGLALHEPLATAVREAEAEGGTTVLTGWNGHVQAALIFQESLRPETERALAGLQSLGLRPEILTGDTCTPAREFLENVRSIPIHRGLLPEEKVAVIQAATTTGVGVGMVGDGINDAPALAAAEVGIALGTKTDLTREAADVNVLEPNLDQVVWLVEYARKVRRIVRQNLWWAFGYNGLAVGLAACGRLNPLIAALAMLLSSLFIVGNARRLVGK